MLTNNFLLLSRMTCRKLIEILTPVWFKTLTFLKEIFTFQFHTYVRGMNWAKQQTREYN